MNSPKGATPSISTAVRAVLRRAAEAYRDSPATATRLRDQIDRLDEPLRVAIAGKVKAGKSTLLNALVGEQIAPTDAGECTRVVTWYRDATSPRVTLMPLNGAPRQLPLTRTDGRLEFDLRGSAPEDVERLVVRLALPQPADHHTDRHSGYRVAVDTALGARHRAARARRPAQRRGRRHLPHASPARH